MRKNRIHAVLAVLVSQPGMPGFTRGEIRERAGLHPDTEITRPIRDLRKPPYNLTVKCDEYQESGERVWRYWIPTDKLDEALAILPQRTVLRDYRNCATGERVALVLESESRP